jgi:hypothetical protein
MLSIGTNNALKKISDPTGLIALRVALLSEMADTFADHGYKLEENTEIGPICDECFSLVSKETSLAKILSKKILLKQDAEKLSGPNIFIPQEYTDICYHAFENREDIISVTMHDNIATIGGSAFRYCRNLTNINISNGITNIYEYAFDGCKRLTDITIPGGLTKINNFVFLCCENLTNVLICDGVTCIDYGAFELCKNLTSITIPNSVTSIGAYAFKDCENLTNITIPDSVTEIGKTLFCGCKSLKNVIIPDGITRIRKNMFLGCDSLVSVTIPNSVTDISIFAFYSCDTVIYCHTNSYAHAYAMERGIRYKIIDSLPLSQKTRDILNNLPKDQQNELRNALFQRGLSF